MYKMIAFCILIETWMHWSDSYLIEAGWRKYVWLV